MLAQARQKNVTVPTEMTTPYINTIDVANEPYFPGDESAERTYRRWLRWNAAVMVTRAQRPGVGVGGHISSYASTATLYEVGFNHFFRGKDHPGGGDHVFFQGHASPGNYARAFIEGRLNEPDLDGFRQEESHPAGGRGLPSYPHPRPLWRTSGSTPLSPWGLARPRRSTGLVRQVPSGRRHQGHLSAAHLGLPGRR